MELKLSCYCCGSTDFKVNLDGLQRIENNTYIPHDILDDNTIICNKCGLEDFINGLVIKVE